MLRSEVAWLLKQIETEQYLAAQHTPNDFVECATYAATTAHMENIDNLSYYENFLPISVGNEANKLVVEHLAILAE